MGGGTRLNAGLVPVRVGAGRSDLGGVEVVDLQAIDLGGIERRPDTVLRIGSMTRLQELADAHDVPSVIREAARHELPSTLRAQSTIGGCIASGDPDSELLASLLVHDARVHIAHRSGSVEVPLEELLTGLPLASGRIITAVSIDPRGTSSLMRTGRTTADQPIVAVVARQVDGRRSVAITGVAASPVLLNSTAVNGESLLPLGEAMAASDLDALSQLDPIGDFRGSSEYRRALARILTARATEAISR
jgi:CO/xanthine dehydrogenase FAD-binding subunit